MRLLRLLKLRRKDAIYLIAICCLSMFLVLTSGTCFYVVFFRLPKHLNEAQIIHDNATNFYAVAYSKLEDISFDLASHGAISSVSDGSPQIDLPPQLIGKGKISSGRAKYLYEDWRYSDGRVERRYQKIDLKSSVK